MANYLIGIDAGNTSSKVVIFDDIGTIISTATTASMRFKKRKEGFEEFDMAELWNLIRISISEAIQKAAIDPSLIKGIGITSFGNGCVFLGKEGEIIAPGCFSQDYRANSIVQMYQDTGAYDEIVKIVRGNFFAGSPASILRWYKENERETYDKIGAVLTFKDYIMYKLTNEFATDLNCYGGSYMLDMETLDYSKELLQLYGIEELYDAMPKLAADSTEVIGHVTAEAALETGLAAGTPVVAGMMDILACLVGAGATSEGVYTAIAGSWCINETSSTQIIDGLSANMPYLNREKYLNCSFTGASGSNYEWFTQVLGDYPRAEAEKQGLTIYQVLNKMIASIKPEDARVLFSPFVAQPSIHPEAKANFIDISQNTSYAELAYAVAEGVGYIHKYHVDDLKSKGLPLSEIRLTGGIAKSKVWNQIFANILQAPIIGIDCDEAGALGMAIAAGIGAGVYQDYEEAFAKAVKTTEPILPDPATFEIYEKRYQDWSELNEILMQYWDKRK